MTVTVRSRWWIPVAAFAAAPLLMLLLVLTPEEERELGDGGILLFSLATAVALGLVLVATYYVRGSEGFEQ
jgi:hypothetical protein